MRGLARALRAGLLTLLAACGASQAAPPGYRNTGYCFGPDDGAAARFRIFRYPSRPPLSNADVGYQILSAHRFHRHRRLGGQRRFGDQHPAQLVPVGQSLQLQRWPQQLPSLPAQARRPPRLRRGQSAASPYDRGSGDAPGLPLRLHVLQRRRQLHDDPGGLCARLPERQARPARGRNRPYRRRSRPRAGDDGSRRRDIFHDVCVMPDARLSSGGQGRDARL